MSFQGPNDGVVEGGLIPEGGGDRVTDYSCHRRRLFAVVIKVILITDGRNGPNVLSTRIVL
jgi:hypothetical protein